MNVISGMLNNQELNDEIKKILQLSIGGSSIKSIKQISKR